MLRKAMMLVVATAALAALSIPATASAKWAHTTQPGGQVVDLAQNTNIQLTGEFGWQSQAGSLHCEFVANAQLVAGTTTGTTQFDVDNNGAANDEPKCSVGGATLAIGCTDVEQVTVAGLPWGIHAVSKTTIDITTGTIQFHLTGGALCPKTKQLTPGTVHFNTAADWWHTGTLHGELQLHTVPGGGTTSQTTITGSATVTPASTYGST